MVFEESLFLFEEEKLFVFCNDYPEGFRGVGMEKQMCDCDCPLLRRMFECAQTCLDTRLFEGFHKFLKSKHIPC